MKATLKAIRAAAVMAQEWQLPLTTVLDRNPYAEALYLELRVRGLYWDTKQKQWLKPQKDIPAPAAPAVERFPVQLRVMAANVVQTGIAAALLVGALEESGFNVLRQSECKQNYGDDGGRVYLDVEV